MNHRIDEDDEGECRFERIKKSVGTHLGKKQIRRTMEADCGSKSRMSKSTAMKMRDKGLRPYHCPFCGQWHVSSSSLSPRKR